MIERRALLAMVLLSPLVVPARAAITLGTGPAMHGVTTPMRSEWPDRLRPLLDPRQSLAYE